MRRARDPSACFMAAANCFVVVLLEPNATMPPMTAEIASIAQGNRIELEKAEGRADQPEGAACDGDLREDLHLAATFERLGKLFDVRFQPRDLGARVFILIDGEGLCAIVPEFHVSPLPVGCLIFDRPA